MSVCASLGLKVKPIIHPLSREGSTSPTSQWPWLTNLPPQNLLSNPSNIPKIKLTSTNNITKRNPQRLQIFNSEKKKCLRCNTLYHNTDNSPTACSFHGHTTGEKGLYALAPPHQGIDREWTDRSGVIVYKWNNKENRPNTGRANWKKRWSCCGEYDENAPPCRHGFHVSYDDGFTLY